MNLQTQIPLRQQKHLIDYHSNVLLMGSCFVDSMGEKLEYFKFQSQSNPFGILFHPKAIENVITRIAQKNLFTEDDLFWHQERWHSLEVHSTYSDTDKQRLLSELNEKIGSGHHRLKEVSHLVITLGTAWGYKHLESQKIVANCHKLPQHHFEKQLSSIDEIQNSILEIISIFRAINPEASLIFTVSPIRHLKDGFVENQRSKAHLVAAIHQCIEISNTLKIAYFPSYEIVMDELRDYRFYSEDMIHLGTTAINYIWERFVSTWLSPAAAVDMGKVDKIQNGLSHRPFNPNSTQYLDFKEKLQQKIAYISEKYPHMQF